MRRGCGRRPSAAFPSATDLADWLVRVKGLPFRRAHHVAGAIVKQAEAQGCALEALPLAAMQAVEPAITADVFDVLGVEASVAQPHLRRRHRAGARARGVGGGAAALSRLRLRSAVCQAAKATFLYHVNRI